MAFHIPKPIEFVPRDTKIPFVSFFKACFATSVILNLVTIILLATVGLNLGIDFKGGIVLEVKAQQGDADIAMLREKTGALNLGEVQVQEFGSAKGALIRLSEQLGGQKGKDDAVVKVRDALGSAYVIERTDAVSGTVSRELLNQSMLAVALTCLAIFTYVWFRFEWQFALGAIVALVHDVFLTVGVFSAFQINFDVTIIAALLTILGYSINDTVVIYDRIRENLRKFKKMPLTDLLDLSVNETLGRTLMTVSTTLLALLALYFLGGEVIRGFVFAMLFGVVVGTYSSVFIAAPFLIMIGVKRDWSNTDTKSARTVKA